MKTLIFLIPLVVFGCSQEREDTRLQVIVSTDIGGSDPDDFQSMVHFFMYADRFDIKGLISSPSHDGRASHILEAIDAYEKDYPKLVNQNKNFPSPDYLRRHTRQGAIDAQKTEQPNSLSEGAEWIISKAKGTNIHCMFWFGGPLRMWPKPFMLHPISKRSFVCILLVHGILFRIHCQEITFTVTTKTYGGSRAILLFGVCTWEDTRRVIMETCLLWRPI